MTDIFAAIQTNTDSTALLPIATSTSNATEGSDGQFEAIMTECLDGIEETVSEEPTTLIPTDDAQELLTFTGNNSFVRSVLDILVGDNEPEKPELSETPEDTLDAVIWPDDEQTEQAEDANDTNSRLGQAVNDVVAKVKDFVSDKLKDAGVSDSDIQALVDEYIYNRKELGEVISSLSDKVKQEAANIINDIVDSLKHEDGSETQPVVKILDSLTQRIAPKAPAQTDATDEDSDDSDDEELTDDTQDSELAAELAGLEGLALTSPQAQQADSTQDTQPNIDDSPRRTQNTANTSQPRQVRTAQTESQTQAQEQQSTSETRDNVQNFRDVLEARTDGNAETQDSDDQSQNQGQSFTQGRGDSNARDSSARSRTDTRRADSRTTTTDRTDSTTTTHRTESRSDFQAYFEGVLSSRRTASTSSPLPLNLRSTESFTQASMLRDGLTNVVRFIRADGVQKARVIVDPPALGRISVELTSGTSGVEASIKVASEQIRQLVQDQLSELRMNLSQQGVQVAEFTVDVQQDNSGSQSQQGQDQSRQYANYFGSDDEDETEEFRVDLEDGLLYWVA